MNFKRLGFGLALLPLLAACGGGGGGSSGTATSVFVPIELVPGVGPGMLASNEDAEEPAISGNGRFVVFQDESGNAIRGDTNERDDVMYFDVATGAHRHISRGVGGALGTGDADEPSIDADGLRVAYESEATNHVADDTNGERDIFLYDATTDTTTRVNVDSAGNQAQGGISRNPEISADGSVIVFQSGATNLVVGDSNVSDDVFAHDTNTGVTTRISVSSAGAQIDTGEATDPHVSADGNLVVFESSSSDITPRISGTFNHVFLHDRTLGTTILISANAAGDSANGNSNKPRISVDGAIIVFSSEASDLVPGDTNNNRDIFAYEVATGATTRVSVGPVGVEAVGGDSQTPDLNGDGRYVVYESYATNLLPGDTNQERDVFRHDRLTGQTIRVSGANDGGAGDAGATDARISHDGMRVVFMQLSGFLAPDGLRVPGNDDVFIKDLETGALTLLSTAAVRSDVDGTVYASALSANGAWLVFESNGTNVIPGDTNNRTDLFLRNMATGEVTRAFETPSYVESQNMYERLSVSNDGQCICFESFENDFLGPGVDTNGAKDVFVINVFNGTIVRASVHTDGTQANGRSGEPVMSADGRFVLFWTDATNLVTGDVTANRELMLRDLLLGTTSRAVFDKDGLPIEDDVEGGDMSDNGRYISFETRAEDLMTTPDTNGLIDIYRYDRDTGVSVRASVDGVGGQVSDESSRYPRMSGDGMVLMWTSPSAEFVADDTNGTQDVFVRDLGQGTTTRINVDSMGNQSTEPGEPPLLVDLSVDGRVAVFATRVTDLAEGLTGNILRVFAHERTTGTTIVAGRAPNGGLPEWNCSADRRCLGPDGNLLIYRTEYLGLQRLFLTDLRSISD